MGYFLFALGLFLFAAIGHLFWVIGAAILRWIFGLSLAHPATPRHNPKPRPFTQCPACRGHVSAADDHCLFCEFPLDDLRARQLNRVREAEAELRDLLSAN
jgi:hypothetical protein